MDGENAIPDGYIFFTSFHEATRDLDDAQYGKLMRAINEYAFHDAEPEGLDGILKMAFCLIKPQIDANKRKRGKYLKTVEEGRKGGAPAGNRNASRNNPEISENNLQNNLENNFEFFENNLENNQVVFDETTINGNGESNVNVKENGDGNAEKQPPPLFIKNKLGRYGFYLDDRDVKRLVSEISPEWFTEPHGFLDFILEMVLKDYGKKEKREQHRIFRKLLFDAGNLRQAYPGWRLQKEERSAAAAKEEALQAAIKNHPERCGCGDDFENWHGDWICRRCKARHKFNKETLKWEPVDWGK